MGKTRIIAETGAGQHGVATATACARAGLSCIVYMGREDLRRQEPNVFRMELLGAEVRPVDSGSATLKDAMNEALRDWVAAADDTFYVIGSVAGPHPYPEMVRDLQCVIGEETRRQLAERLAEEEGAGGGGSGGAGESGAQTLPDLLVACVGGGSNAIGLFHPFLDEPSVRMVGVEAGGEGPETGRHAAALTAGEAGVLHGSKSAYLQDGDGQILEAHSISAGLDYPASARARVAEEHRPGALQLCERRRGVGGLPHLRGEGRDPSCSGAEPRSGLAPARGAVAGGELAGGGQSLRTGRQRYLRCRRTSQGEGRERARNGRGSERKGGAEGR